jgi:hypothetical protein
MQVVSAGALIGSINQFDVLWPFLGDLAFLSFLTLQLVALGLAVFAAYAKHQYKVWDVKASAAQSRNDNYLASNHEEKANDWLPRMRRSITASMAAILAGLAVFLVAAWMTN